MSAKIRGGKVKYYAGKRKVRSKSFWQTKIKFVTEPDLSYFLIFFEKNIIAQNCYFLASIIADIANVKLIYQNN